MPKLALQPVYKRLDLLPKTTRAFLEQWPGNHEVMIAEIEAAYTGSKEFSEHYEVSPDETMNCVVVEAVRGDATTYAACVAPSSYRMDLNKRARKILGARRVSFAQLDMVLAATGMEYGSISPIGLPSEWRILIDARIIDLPQVVIGGGFVKIKLVLPGSLLATIPGAEVVEELGV